MIAYLQCLDLDCLGPHLCCGIIGTMLVSMEPTTVQQYDALFDLDICPVLLGCLFVQTHAGMHTCTLIRTHKCTFACTHTCTLARKHTCTSNVTGNVQQCTTLEQRDNVKLLEKADGNTGKPLNCQPSQMCMSMI